MRLSPCVFLVASKALFARQEGWLAWFYLPSADHIPLWIILAAHASIAMGHPQHGGVRRHRRQKCGAPAPLVHHALWTTTARKEPAAALEPFLFQCSGADGTHMTPRTRREEIVGRPADWQLHTE